MHYEKITNAKGEVSYLFVKRVNAKRGTYALFKDKVKRKLSATKDSEAEIESTQWADDLAHLQTVSKKDGKLALSTKDKNRAASTWVRLIAGIDLEHLHEFRKRLNKDGDDARQILDFIVGEVTSHYETRYLDHEGVPNGYLSDFGEHLLGFLKAENGKGSISEGIEIYLRQAQLDHLSPEDREVRTVNRVVAQFVEIVGDKQIDQINRRDAEKYINKRLENVKTTSVGREIATLRALWNRCADHLDIPQRNPFANQPIKGLGLDSETRATPTLDETQRLILLLEERKPHVDSYVIPYIAVAALAGLRLSEVWLIQEENYDRANDILHLKPNTRKRSLKTTNSNRPIPVLPELAEWLEILLEQKPPSTANSASAATLKWLKSQGIDFGNHSLRHGFKQRLIECDVPLYIVEELQGWSRQTMADKYGFLTVSQKKIDAISSVYRKLYPSTAQVIPLRA